MTAYPAAFVDIWPADGGVLHLSAFESGLLAVQTSKDIWNPNSGAFQIALAPGGPYGANASPQWYDIITPMSLVIIGLQRSVVSESRANIVMVGVVTDIQEDVGWRFGRDVRRVTRVIGQDFSYFFQQSCAYSDTLVRYGQPYIAQLGLTSYGIATGSPDQLAKTFYNQIVAGTGGVMSSTTLQYDGGAVKLTDLMEANFLPYTNLPLSIPAAWNFLALSGSWFESFGSLLPFPWYELGVFTAGPGQYGQSASSATLSIGDVPFFLPANPVMLARPLPIPKFSSASSLTLDTSAWNGLPVFSPDNEGLAVLDSSGSRSLGAVKNFYIFNPLVLNGQFGHSNAGVSPWLYDYGSWIDISSIERYGFRPRIDNLAWFSDPTGQQAQTNAQAGTQFRDTIGIVSLLPVAFHQPTPLMRDASVRLNLRPDIYPGVRFRCILGKNFDSWDFYCRSVEHSFIFGGECTTSLGLCRGLPTAVYSNTQLLQSIYLGKGAVVDGVYQVGSGTGIQVFNMKTSAHELAEIAPIFATPGKQ